MAKEKLCPLLKKECLEHSCRWYVQLQGTNPQTGGPLPNEGWGCTVEWLPLLMVETAKEVRQSAAATESLRNENVSVGGALVNAIQNARRLT